jgi:hypothetical protein
MIVDVGTGRKLDDLDIVMIQATAQTIIPKGDGYGIYTTDGAGICGFVPDDKATVHNFTHQRWVTKSAHLA